MKKITLIVILAMSSHFMWAQPTTYGVGAGVGGNISNSYFGVGAGSVNTSFRNTFIGSNSGALNVTGYANTFLGDSSGSFNTHSYNTFIGATCGNHNTTGEANTFVGAKSGSYNFTGSSNTFLGTSSGQLNTTGGNNTYLGTESGGSNQIGTGNVFIGSQAGYSELGSNFLYIDNSGTNLPLIWGNFSTNILKVNGALGVGLPLGNNPSETIDIIGTARLRGVPQDNALTRILVTDLNGSVRWRDVNSLPIGATDNLGNHTATQDITANLNGVYDIGSVASAFNSIFLDGSLYLDNLQFLHNANGSASVALGLNSLLNSNSGNNNVAIGNTSAAAVTSGINNVAVGNASLPFISTGSSNTAVGYNAGPGNGFQSGFFNTTTVGNQARSTASNQARIGNSSVTSIGGIVAWSNLSDERFKYNVERDSDKVPGLDVLEKLEPVKYQVDKQKLGAFLHEDISSAQPSTGSEVGFLAQDLMKALPSDIVLSIVDKPEDENTGPYGVRYSAMTAITINAVKQLHELIKAQQEQIEELKALLKSDGARISSSSSQSVVDANAELLKGVVLQQSYPNPSQGAITIDMTIPDRVKNATVIIHNLQGDIKSQSYEIKDRGHTMLNVSREKFEPGVYSYKLIVDGAETESKRILIIH